MRSHEAPRAQGEAHTAAQPWAHLGDDFVLMHEVKPPPRIALARERMLMSRLYLGLIRSISDDYGAEFAANSDSAQGGCLAGNGTDTIVLPAGDYDLNGGQLHVTTSLNLVGAGAGLTTVDGLRATRLMLIGTNGGPSLTVAISGLPALS